MNLEELKNWFNEFRSNWKKALFLLCAVVLVLIVVVYVTSFVSEKAKKHATSESPKTLSEEIIPQKKEPETKSKKVESPTLHEYFKTDFSNYLAANRNVGIRVFTAGSAPGNQHDYEIEFRLHCDFESLTKFLSFYLPSSTLKDANSICKVIAEQAPEITSLLSKGIIVAGSRYDDRLTEIKDLKFTGRVYVYHDAYLSADEIDELRDFYKQRSLDTRFRGSNYLIKRHLYKDSNSDSSDN